MFDADESTLAPVLSRRSVMGLLALGALHSQVQAAGYPVKPARIVVPYAPGGGSDTAARAIAQRLTESLGQSFIVENRAGAATQAGTLAVTRALADGYTLLLGTANLATNSSLYQKLPYDAVHDLEPISLITKAPVYVAVRKDSAIKDLKDLIAHAKASKTGLNYGTPGNGSIPHLACELFASLAGIRLQHVPYKGSSETVAALAGGQLDLTFDNLTPISGMVKAGKLRAISMTAAKRSALMPNVPTMQELGYPMEASSWWGLLAPTGLPPEVLATLHKAMADALATAQMREQLARVGIEPESCSPAAFAAFIKDESDKWAAVVKSAGIKAG